MIGIVIGLGFLLAVAIVYIVKLRFMVDELLSESKLASVKQRLLIDYIDTLNKQIPTKKEKK